MTTPLHKVLKNMESFDLICLTRNSFNSIVSCQVQKKIYNDKELFNIYELINQLITFLSTYIKSKEIIDNTHKNLIKSGVGSGFQF